MSLDPKSKALSVAGAALDKKAEKVVILNVEEVTLVADYFVICSARSDTHLDAIKRGIEEELESKGVTLSRCEGRLESGWILLDYNDVIVHIFLQELREYYDLERLWRDARKIEIEDDGGEDRKDKEASLGLDSEQL